MNNLHDKIALPKNITTIDTIKNLESSGLQIVILIDQENRVIATITDSDIRKGFADGLKINQKIFPYANKKPQTVTNDATYDEIKSLFRINPGFKAIPVVDNKNKLIGCHFIDEFLNRGVIDAPFLIMAGGFGKRLGKLTSNCPKPMLKIGDKPILQHIIEKAKKDGFFNIFISTHFLSHIIENYFEDGKKFDVNIKYLKEERPLGTAGCLQLLPEIKTPIVVTNGDLISKIGYKTILDFHYSVASSATMAVVEHKIQHPFGVINSDGINLTSFEEKPIWKTNINAGIYVLNQSVIKLVKRNEVVSMPDIFKRVQMRNKKTTIFPIHEKWMDLGTPQNLKKANP